MKRRSFLKLLPAVVGAAYLPPLPVAKPIRRGWTTPRTWKTGELVTAAMMNQHIRDHYSVIKAIS